MSTAELTLDPPADTTRRGSEYAELMRQVRDAGLLKRRPVYYGIHIALGLVLLAAGWTAFVLIGESWWQLLIAVYLAWAFTQNGFLTHDAGHAQIFRSRRANRLVGLVHGNLAIGLVFGWWVEKHHRHHAHPNQEGLDPDIDGDDIVYTREQAERRRGLGRVIARHQGALFFPMLLLLALSLRVAGVKALLRPGFRNRVPEAILFALHIVGYLTVVLLVLSPLHALVFIAVHQGLLGVYLGSVFAPNHKGMPILSADDNRDFLHRQVLTARNVYGGRVTDMLLGGLNYQIEHHLFPSMPRPSLRYSQPIIREYCVSHGLPYAETSLLDSYRQALRHLDSVGRVEPAGTEPVAVRELVASGARATDE